MVRLELGIAWIVLVVLIVAAGGACSSGASVSENEAESTAASSSETETETGTERCGEGDALGEQLADCEFDVPGAAWSWRREMPAAWRLEAGALEMQSLGGTLWEQQNDNLNVALRQVPELEEGGVIEVHVAGPVANDGEQAGLLWFFDDDHYLKLVKEQVFGNRMTVMVVELDASPSVVAFEPAEADAVSLRLQRVGPELIGWVRLEGEAEFRELGRVSLDSWPQGGVGAQGGLFTHGAEISEDRWIRFSAFGVYRDE